MFCKLHSMRHQPCQECERIGRYDFDGFRHRKMPIRCPSPASDVTVTQRRRSPIFPILFLSDIVRFSHTLCTSQREHLHLFFQTHKNAANTHKNTGTRFKMVRFRNLIY